MSKTEKMVCRICKNVVVIANGETDIWCHDGVGASCPARLRWLDRSGVRKAKASASFKEAA